MQGKTAVFKKPPQNPPLIGKRQGGISGGSFWLKAAKKPSIEAGGSLGRGKKANFPISEFVK